MELLTLLRLGYAIVIGSFLLMMWISWVESTEIETSNYPPCLFNSLCKCSKSMPDLGIVHCENVHLSRIPESINISKVFKLHLINNGLRTIEPFFLQSTGLYKIAIINNPLAVIPDEAFIGLERTLWELDLSYNDLTEVPTRATKYLQKLKVLDLTGNDIIKIKPEHWRGLGSTLQHLILAENSILHLPTDSFSGLPEVETIDLSGNNLREIDPSVFRDGMNKLTNLILADNQLDTIPYQAVSLLRAIKYLDLSYNKIVSMSPTHEIGTQSVTYNFQLNLDELRLEYNQINILPPAAFQLFNMLNKTYLDGNPITQLGENAFRQAKIKELYLRNCELTEVLPSAFSGLEDYLEVLDLSGNHISELTTGLFDRLLMLKSLFLKNNKITNFKISENFNSLKFSLNRLDISGNENAATSILELGRLKNLRSLTLTKLNKDSISPDDFKDFGVDLEELAITNGGIKHIHNNAFKYVHGIKFIDFSENSINTIENNAFFDIGHSLVTLKIANGFSSSTQNFPVEAFRQLSNLEELDLNNNRIRNLPDTAFHFLKKLKVLEIQDNIIENIQKGTFQGDIHTNLEYLYFSFNNIKVIKQHCFADLPQLRILHLDDNKIDTIERRAFMNLVRLKYLNLKGNKITTIAFEAFQNLPELEYLDLSFNKIASFDFQYFDQIGMLAMLHLNVSHNRLKNLQVNMAGTFNNEFGPMSFHTNVKILDLSSNNISTISRNFFKAVQLSLSHLYLGDNYLMNASMDIFGNMPHLQLLDISDNMLYELEFDTFRNSKNLQILDVCNNRIAEIPNDLFRFLQNIQRVKFCHNRLRTLPDNLFREETIEHLDLSHNQIGKLPLSSFSVPAASDLYELNLSWNSISSLSHGGLLSRFRNLNWLDLSYNRLAQIDAETFRDLNKLSSLDLSNNVQLTLEPTGLSFVGLEYSLLHINLDNVSLTQVPVLITRKLVTLSLAYNSLPTVPPEMAKNLSSLCKLNLNYNDLTSVPIVTHSLPELRYFSMAANPVSSLSNTSLLGVADTLKELDIRDLDILEMEAGVFCKLNSLRSLKINYYKNLKGFNLPTLLSHNYGLKNLEIHISYNTEDNLEKQMQGIFPYKLENLTITGRGLKKIGNNILMGISSPNFHFGLRNTSLSTLPSSIFENADNIQNLTIDVRENYGLKTFQNPSTGFKPGLPRQTFLFQVYVSENQWKCDCDIGWMEVWLRKKRQYICGIPSLQIALTDYCRFVDDDLRNSKCANKNNESLIEVLKTDIECGWSGCTKIKFNFIISFLLLLMKFF